MEGERLCYMRFIPDLDDNCDGIIKMKMRVKYQMISGDNGRTQPLKKKGWWKNSSQVGRWLDDDVNRIYWWGDYTYVWFEWEILEVYIDEVIVHMNGLSGRC